ncbi:MAG: PLDc_N domain-containing protein [Planctomycetes bacterium]|nr:PLDc_N domain-containing protein [Planctomycetota bacterium]
MELFGCCFVIVGLFFGCGGTILWIWMLVDCAKNESSEGNDKVVWILVIVFTHWIGALIYLIVRRPARKAKFGK